MCGVRHGLPDGTSSGLRPCCTETTIRELFTLPPARTKVRRTGTAVIIHRNLKGGVYVEEKAESEDRPRDRETGAQGSRRPPRSRAGGGGNRSFTGRRAT